MYTQESKTKDYKSKAVANSVLQKKAHRKQGYGILDTRPEAQQLKFVSFYLPVARADKAVNYWFYLQRFNNKQLKNINTCISTYRLHDKLYKDRQ